MRLRHLSFILLLPLFAACAPNGSAPQPNVTTAQKATLYSCTAFKGAVDAVNAAYDNKLISDKVMLDAKSSVDFVGSICSQPTLPTLSGTEQVAFDNGLAFVEALAQQFGWSIPQ